MRITIRSQDKEKLVVFGENSFLDIMECGDKYTVVMPGVGNLCLGIYNTKERCIKVLDEVQGLIDMSPVCGMQYNQPVYNFDCIYEMPEE